MSVYTLVNTFLTFLSVRIDIGKHFKLSFQANVHTLVPLKAATSVLLGLMNFLVIDECILVKENSHVRFVDGDLFDR